MSKILTWKILSKKNQLIHIKALWNDLNCQCNNNNLFTSFAWIENWLNIFQKNDWQLYVITIYYQNNLISIAPFYIQNNNKYFQKSTLYIIGQGEPEISEVASEYIDILINKDFENEVIDGLIEKINALKVDEISFRAVLFNSNLIKLVKKSYYYTPCYKHLRYIIECNNWSVEQLSKNTRSRYKRSINQLNKKKAVFCWLKSDRFFNAFSKLTDLHQKRWQKRGQLGAFYHQNFIAFHKNLLTNNQINRVRMSAILVDEQPIIINYYLADETTLYFYQTGWNEEKYANFSLGLALHIWSIEHCEHLNYDLMMGNVVNSYKSKFSNSKQKMENIVINLNIIKNFCYKILNKVTKVMGI
ncbi:MAG: GNAT family N-acetyltransferase [Pseudomonadota bacterium]